LQERLASLERNTRNPHRPRDTLARRLAASPANVPASSRSRPFAALFPEESAAVPDFAGEYADLDDPAVVSKLKYHIYCELTKDRPADAPPIEFHDAPRSVPDFVMDLIQKERSSFYFINLSTVVDKYLLWKKKLPRAEPFYAVKSNPDPQIVETLFHLGAGFDCASKGEIQQVLSMGCDPSRIIFANPCKHPDHILFAKENGVAMMTFDNMAELYKIHEHFPEAKLVLRILPDDSYSIMPFGIKFGATLEDSFKLIEKCKELNMTLMGVSFHVGSGCLSGVAWVEALKLARKVFDEAIRVGFDMTLLDLGGGWPGTENGPLTFADIGTEISPVIDELFPPHVKVIGEPGRFFCTEASSLAVYIISKRERTNPQNPDETETQYYISDGVYGSFNCIIFDHAKPEPSFLVDVSDRRLLPSCIFGPTCDSMDLVVKKTLLPEHFPGEWLLFPNMGAYTRAAGSEFNGFSLPVCYYVMTSN